MSLPHGDAPTTDNGSAGSNSLESVGVCDDRLNNIGEQNGDDIVLEIEAIDEEEEDDDPSSNPPSQADEHSKALSESCTGTKPQADMHQHHDAVAHDSTERAVPVPVSLSLASTEAIPMHDCPWEGPPSDSEDRDTPMASEQEEESYSIFAAGVGDD